MAKKIRSGYLGNPNLRKAYEQLNYTKEQIIEIAKCQNDPMYFIENYVKINRIDGGMGAFKLWDFQKEIINATLKNRFTITKLARQSGKTTIYAALALWYTLFTDDYTILLLADQESKAKEALKRVKTAIENLPKWLQQGITRWNEGDIEFENKSRILVSATTPNAARGFTINFLILDELAHVSNNIVEDFFASAIPTITSGQTSKIAIISTPKGLNIFHKMWKDAINHKSNYFPLEFDWTAVPNRDLKFKEETLKTLPGGDNQWRQEFDCEFLGSTNSLIPTRILTTLASTPPLYEDEFMKVYKYPREGRQYFASVDVAEGVEKDYSVINIIDITEMPYEQVAVYKNNKLSNLDFQHIVYKMCTDFNNALLLIELNSTGTELANLLYHDYNYEYILRTSAQMFKDITMSAEGNNLGIKNSKTTKNIGCQTLKKLLEEQKFMIHDENTVFELSNFVSVGKSFKAETGFHDDIVMTCVNFAWATTQEYFNNFTYEALRKLKKKEDGYTPLMIPMDEEDPTFGGGKKYENVGGIVWQVFDYNNNDDY